jgi:hypothetical protein
VGILSQGLRIAPPEVSACGLCVCVCMCMCMCVCGATAESNLIKCTCGGVVQAPVTGYMFGKGVYFAGLFLFPRVVCTLLTHRPNRQCE